MPAAPETVDVTELLLQDSRQEPAQDSVPEQNLDEEPVTGKLLGREEPRLFTQPLRPLTRETSRGYEVIDFAEMVGEPLLPWQKFAVIHALELNPDGGFRFRTVLILVARQNGKSSLKRMVSLWRLYIDGARVILGTAQDVKQAREQWTHCIETIRSCPALAEELE